MPITFITFLIGTLAISGIPPFAGFFSKDEILANVFQQNLVLWGLGVVASMLTAFYMFRLLFLTFFNGFRGTDEQKHHLHESPSLMTLPLIILAILATVGGWIGLPHIFHAPHLLNDYLSPVIMHTDHEATHLSASTEYMLVAVAIGGALISIGIAYVKYISGAKVPGADASYSGLLKIVHRKFYIDELYHFLIVRPTQWISELLYKVVDKLLVDGVVQASGRLSLLASDVVRSIQTGHTAFYILAMVLSVCFILGYYLIGIK